MTEQKPDGLEKLLRTEIEAAKAEIARLRELTQPVAPDSALGRLTRLDAMQNKSVNEKALANKKRTLAGLERLLKTMDAPDFGLCVECGNPIPMARLLRMPESPLCVECAEIADTGPA